MIISLSFDDALDQHLDNAVPILNEARLTGTFYTHLSAPSLASRFNEWKQVANTFHELGNHTIFHPADERKTWVRPGNALDSYFPDRMSLEAEVANQWLDSIDGGALRSFAYPCSNSFLGRYGVVNRALFWLGQRNTRLPGFVEKFGIDFGSSRESYIDEIRQLFVAARGGGLHIHQQAPDVSKINQYLLPSAAVENHSFSEMKGFIERSLESGGWPILQFHGIGGGHHMDCEFSEFRALVNWLAEHHAKRVVTVAQGAIKLFGLQRKKETFGTDG